MMGSHEVCKEGTTPTQRHVDHPGLCNEHADLKMSASCCIILHLFSSCSVHDTVIALLAMQSHSS